ncbi:MAG: alpha-L-fucosidase [Eubacteriales bacterium]|nr:alpha-L-fucosidase [Eubacteriales bacterium]
MLEVAKACRKYGVKLWLYYSLWDRHEKCYKDDEKYVDYMCSQLTELLGGKYGEIVEVWFDGGWDKKADKWNIPKLYDLVHRLQPNCVRRKRYDRIYLVQKVAKKVFAGKI